MIALSTIATSVDYYAKRDIVFCGKRLPFYIVLDTIARTSEIVTRDNKHTLVQIYIHLVLPKLSKFTLGSGGIFPKIVWYILQPFKNSGTSQK